MRAQRGYALLMVIMVLALIALGFSTVLYVIQSDLTETRRILGETRCFYADDSASRIASQAVEAAAVQMPADTPPDVASQLALDKVCQIANAGCSGSPPMPTGIMPPGVTMTQFKVNVTPTTAYAAASAGPMRNVYVKDSGMTVYLAGQDDGTGRVCHVSDTFFTGTVSAFEFSFYAAGDAMFYAHDNFTSPTSLYASGDLCIGAYAGKTFSIPTVGAGDDLHTPSGGTARHRRHRPRTRANISCPSPAGGAGTAKVAGVIYVQPDYGNSFDQANVLTLPVTTVPAMQGDNKADLLSTRWLLDPVFGDNAAVRSLKLADLADIRVIDGVWFVAGNGAAWPGTAIYSDHPGSSVPAQGELATLVAGAAASSINIGLEDVHQALITTGALGSTDPWPPRRYSYYETTLAGALVDGTGGGGPLDELGIISYGALKNNGSSVTAPWLPGLWAGTSVATGTPVCTNTGALIAFNDGSCTSHAAALLDGARSGFHDVNAARRGSQSANEERILPINVDVGALTSALRDHTPGELGSYFVPPHNFNGIIWVSATWDHSLRGIDGTPGGNYTSTMPPPQGGVLAASGGGAPGGGGGGGGGLPALPGGGGGGGLPAGIDAAAPVPNNSPGTQAANAAAFAGGNANFFLPAALCASTALDTQPLAPGFENLACSSPLRASGSLQDFAWGNGGQGSRANAVRVFNGSELRPYQGVTVSGLPPVSQVGGLTVATNLPLYVMGDWNVQRSSSNVFPRSMLAGDTVTALSPTWDDGDASWSTKLDGSYSPPAAGPAHSVGSDTGATVSASQMVRAAIIVGRTPDGRRPANQDIEQLVRSLEQFTSGAQLVLDGALMLGFTSVYRDDYQDTSGGFNAPSLNFIYDTTLQYPTYQPAGAPRFLAGVTGKWKDSR